MLRYDIYILQKLQGKNIDLNSLKAALKATTEKRNSSEIIEQYTDIISVIKNSSVMQKHWTDYQKDFDYAADIKFEDACGTIKEILDALQVL